MSDAGTLFELDKPYVFTLQGDNEIVGTFLSASPFNDETIITIQASDGIIHRVKFRTIERWRLKEE